MRKTRLRLGLTQEDVAFGLGIRRQSYTSLEHGIKRMTLERILEVAAFFNVHYLTLLESYVPGRSGPVTPQDRVVPRFDVSDPVQMGADPMAAQAPDTTPLDDEPSYLVIE